jgi:hypothetical protein
VWGRGFPALRGSQAGFIGRHRGLAPCGSEAQEISPSAPPSYQRVGLQKLTLFLCCVTVTVPVHYFSLAKIEMSRKFFEIVSLEYSRYPKVSFLLDRQNHMITFVELLWPVFKPVPHATETDLAPGIGKLGTVNAVHVDPDLSHVLEKYFLKNVQVQSSTCYFWWRCAAESA